MQELIERRTSAKANPWGHRPGAGEIKAAIVAGMTENRLYTVMEIIKKIPECNDLANQKVSALFRQLCAENKTERLEEKKKAYFRLK